MAIDIPVVFVVRVMGAEKSRTYRAGEVFHVILLAWVRSNYGSTEAWIRYGHTAGGDITSPQCHTTFGADEVQTPEVIPFTQWVLFFIYTFNREELGGHHVPAILRQRDMIVHIDGKRCETDAPCT